MRPESQAQEYARWVKTVNLTAPKGWQCVEGWKFRSPSGSLHDLSAADLTQLSLDRIEESNLFYVSPFQYVPGPVET